MKILAMDTSAIVATVAIMEDGKLISEVVLNHKRTHSQKLMPMVEQALEMAELSARDIDIFSAAIGPGSFTGLRIGVATVKALAHAAGKKTVGVNTLDGLAYNVPFFSGRICPIMDARREQVYTALYRWNGEELSRESEYKALPIGEILEELQSGSESVLFLGDGMPVHQETIKASLGEKAFFVPGSCSLQRASSIAVIAYQKALRGETTDYMSLEPFYLRKPQAEREYDRKCGAEMRE